MNYVAYFRLQYTSQFYIMEFTKKNSFPLTCFRIFLNIYNNYNIKFILLYYKFVEILTSKIKIFAVFRILNIINCTSLFFFCFFNYN